MSETFSFKKGENGLLGISDGQGNWVIEPAFTSESFEWEDLLIVEKPDGDESLWGIFSKETGDWIEEPNYGCIELTESDRWCLDAWCDGDLFHVYAGGEIIMADMEDDEEEYDDEDDEEWDDEE